MILRITKVIQDKYNNASREEQILIFEKEIAPYFKEYEGVARTRTIEETDYQTGLRTLEEKFKFVPKKYLKGSEMTYIPHAHHFANCYNGTPYGSFVTWTHDGKKWYISDAGRCTCNQSHKWEGILSQSAETAVINAINCGDFFNN